MLAIHVDFKQQDWANLLPVVQLAFNTLYGFTVQEIPIYVVFGHKARLLSIYVFLDLSHAC